MIDIGLQLVDEMVAARRHLHAYPELSNSEFQTQNYIVDWLAAHGIPNVSRVAGTGVKVDIVGEDAGSGRKVAVRADIDALPIHEQTNLSFASKSPGQMHACGHDAHTAMVLAAVVTLHERKKDFAGTVRFIFQPAEEDTPSGGKRVVQEEKLLDGFDAAIGIHVDPYLATGQVAVGAGSYTLAADLFDVVIHGRSAHAARAHDGVDSIAIAASIVAEVQKLVSREADALDSLIVSVTSINGGNAYNIIPDTVSMKGTIRSSNKTTRDRAIKRFKEIVSGLAAIHEAEAEIRFIEGEPAVINDIGMVKIIEDAVFAVAGGGALSKLPGWTAADDFGYYSDRVPSVYFRLGIRNEDVGSIFPLHHPEFRVDESAMKLGAATLATAATMFLAPKPSTA